MNRLDKEMCRKFMHDHIDHLSDKQRQDFIRIFATRPRMTPEDVIASIDNKMLRRANRFIQTIVKQY